MSLENTLKTKVVSQLNWDGRIDAKDIDVEIDGRDVTLTGVVPSYPAELAAVEDALHVSGVDSVINEIETNIPEDKGVTDSLTETRIENGLTWNSDLTSFKIDVSVHNSWVTLAGTVDAVWKRYLAEDIANGTLGVVGVTNKLAVVIDHDIEDEIIAENIADAIDRDSRVQIDNVNVAVTDGKVILSGSVHNYTAKTAALNSAIHTPGVREVKNNINVVFP